jgi:hypothetical protein
VAIAFSEDVRELPGAPSYVPLSTLRADGSPRNWVVWAGRTLGFVRRPGPR